MTTQTLPDVSAALDVLNAHLDGLGMGAFRLAVVEVAAIELAPKNARYMRNETFKNLVENIKRDGALASVPFCWKKPDGVFRVLSGNHRVKAAAAAGITHTLVLYVEGDLERDRELAIQISHNAIAGQDDPVLLKELWEEIEDLSLKYYAGLDDKVLGELEAVSLASLQEVRLDFRTLSFLFLPEEVDRLNATFAAATEAVKGNELYLARFRDFERALEAQAATGKAYGIHNAATSLALILDVFEAHREDLSAGWLGEDGEATREGWVPLVSILGADVVPAAAGAVIARAVAKMRDAGDVQTGSLWKALELWAADWLAGAD